MSQTPEAEAFLARIATLPPGPGVSEKLFDVLQASLDDEAELRKLFATDKSNARLDNPYVGLVDVFDAPDAVRTTRARVVKDEADLTAQCIMPLSDAQRRKEGAPAMVATLEDFQKNWAIFSEGSLSQLLDWNNVIAAGGAIQACLNPLPDSAKVSKRALRNHYHTNEYPTSDVDLFLYGMTPEQAEVKINAIYAAVRDSVPWDVTCVRTKHAVSIHSQYPYRAVQIVLRLYRSPAEILAGFDVDAPCCAYDGQRVWASPRAIVAMMRQCNTIDVTRRSPSYEVRLAKYSERGFEVYVPTLRRNDIDPTIFERSIARIQGLARLLVLEKLRDTVARTAYLEQRRDLRGRQSVQQIRRRAEQIRRRKVKRRYKGDLKADIDFTGLEMNDYDVVSLHIPYGPGWDVRRIEKLIYQTDLGMNSPFNPKNKDRRLHRHPAFFGTMQECLNDCCEYCIEPKNEEEKAQQEEEDKSYIRGRVEFMQEDPGRQSITGSFNPIDAGEWAEQAYIGPTEKLFNAIAANDRATVALLIQQEDTDVNRRDHVGRTALQLAVMCKASDIACDLVDAGARMTARVADGRNALHLAAQLNLPAVVRKLLERSAVNAEKMKEEAEEKQKKEKQKKTGRDEEKMDVDDSEDKQESAGEDGGSEDDWQSDEDAETKKTPKAEEQSQGDDGQMSEDEEEQPDVFDINATDWDLAFTPLQFAIVSGSVPIVDELTAAGADVKLVTVANRLYNAPHLHQLTTTILTENEDTACQIANRLIAAGAVSSEADDELTTILHRIVCAGKPQLVSSILRSDPNARMVIDTPHITRNRNMISPVMSAITRGNYSTLAILLAYNAKLALTEEDIYSALEAKSKGPRTHYFGRSQTNIHMPIETAIAKFDDVVELLVALGTDINAPTMEALQRNHQKDYHHTVIDWVRCAILAIERRLEWVDPPNDDSDLLELESTPGWKGQRAPLRRKRRELELESHSESSRPSNEDRQRLMEARDYLAAAEALLSSHGAKTWDDLYPDDKADGEAGTYLIRRSSTGREGTKVNLGYQRVNGKWYNSCAVPSHLIARYDELFNACWNGDNAAIQQLCLPKDSLNPKETPLQIVVWLNDTYDTPLSIALECRHWATARLILAVAHAQHQSDNTKLKFQTHNIVLDNDDSEDSDEDEDMDSDDEVIDFVDIAKRTSAVQTPANPKNLLQEICVHWLGEDGKEAVGNVLKRAIISNDLEAFVKIVDLHSSLPEPVDLDPSTLNDLIQFDRPEMLDELIRRTGAGISIEAPANENDHSEAIKKKNPYLGLNVHGKKRKDLAAKGDPNAPPTTNNATIPILWLAARAGALSIIKYLAGERPLSAYQYYSSSHSDERAQQLKQVQNLLDVLPRLLGWALNVVNESVMTAAVIGDHLDSIEALIRLQSAQMTSALAVKIKPVEFNHILVAANWGCSPELFDFLMTQDVSPLAVDHRGWNILHLLCFQGADKHVKLLGHVLCKLPQEAMASLLVQQSKVLKNTPLHLAVMRRRLDIVRILLSVEAPQFLIRDVSGSTPLHIAVKQSCAEIIQLLLQSGPAETLFMEDGVGCTPLETASQNFLEHKVTSGYPAVIYRPDILWDGFTGTIERKPITKLIPSNQEEEVPRLRATIQQLLQEGRLRNGTKLATELIAFTDKMEARLAERAAQAASQVDATETDSGSGAKTYSTENTLRCLVEAISRADSTLRRLVHLSDVRQSVNNSLRRSTRASGTQNPREVDDGLPQAVEETPEQLFSRSSVMVQWPMMVQWSNTGSSAELFNE